MMEYSIKDNTRNTGQKGASEHQLSLTMPLPPQKVLLTNTQNKIQLVDLIDEALKKEKDQLSLCGHKLVVTGRDQVLTEINKGIVIPRRDLETSQEEADVIIVQQMVAITEHGGDGIRVLCDDTDVFVFYSLMNMSCPLTMESFSKDRQCIDIKATVTKHKDM